MKCQNVYAKRRPKTAILPSINSHPNNIEIYEAVNESVTFQSEGKQKNMYRKTLTIDNTF